MDMVEAVFGAYLSGVTDGEISFLGGCLGIDLPRQKPADSSEMWAMRTERALGRSRGRAAAKRFRSGYAALKGLFLFWIDCRLSEAAEGSDDPRTYHRRLDSITRRHCAGDRRKTELFDEIRRRHAGFAASYLEHCTFCGPLGRGMGFERRAFRLALGTAPDSCGVGCGPAPDERADGYLLSCKAAIFNLLGMLKEG
jgi:hypothetical protein